MGSHSLLIPVAGGFPLPASFLYPVRNKGKEKRGGDGSKMSHLDPVDLHSRIYWFRQLFQVGHAWEFYAVS